MAELFDALEATIRERRSGLDHAGQLLGLTFERTQAGSNDWFEIVTAGPSRLFRELASAEIRIERKTGNIRLMLLGVDKQERCLAEEDITRRFGSSPELSVPTPRQPPDSPIFYVYRQPWGDLRIGMSRAGQKCVETIVTEFNN